MPITHRVHAALVGLVLAAGALTAQTAPQRPPRWFASGGVGLNWGQVYIVDQATTSAWDFDAGFLLRGTIEREVAPRLAVGLAFSYSRLPLTYNALGATTGPCVRCAADATVSSWGALVRHGGGPGIHRIIEVFAGAIRYGNFTEAATGTTLAPSSNTDFAFGAGYGFGVSISQDWQVTLVQDAAYAIHERSTLSQAGGRVSRHYSTRLGLRVGF